MGKYHQYSDSLEGWCNSTQFCFPGKLLLSLPYFPHQETYLPSHHVNTFSLTLPSQDNTILPIASVSSMKIVSILQEIRDFLFSAHS